VSVAVCLEITFISTVILISAMNRRVWERSKNDLQEIPVLAVCWHLQHVYVTCTQLSLHYVSSLCLKFYRRQPITRLISALYPQQLISPVTPSRDIN